MAESIAGVNRGGIKHEGETIWIVQLAHPRSRIPEQIEIAAGSVRVD